MADWATWWRQLWCKHEHTECRMHANPEFMIAGFEFRCLDCGLTPLLKQDLTPEMQNELNRTMSEMLAEKIKADNDAPDTTRQDPT